MKNITIKEIKGFSSAYPNICDLKLLPNRDGTWLTIQDNVGTSLTIKLSDLSAIKGGPKIGHWIYDDECREHGHCSECGYGSIDLVDGKPYNYCSNCGKKMQEVEK